MRTPLYKLIVFSSLAVLTWLTWRATLRWFPDENAIVGPVEMARIVRDLGLPFLAALLWCMVAEAVVAMREGDPTFYAFLLPIASLATVLWVWTFIIALSSRAPLEGAEMVLRPFMAAGGRVVLIAVLACALFGLALGIGASDSSIGRGVWFIRLVPAAFFAFWAIFHGYTLLAHRYEEYIVAQ